MKRAVVVVSALLCGIGAESAAWADPAPDKAACLAATAEAQTLRDAHKLIEARDQLRICAQKGCPRVVQKDCLTWLEAVEQSLPTIVVSAKDGAGHDRVDVSVTLDGQPLAAKLTGEALPANPGDHVVHFETPDGARLDQQVLVREGVKNQSIAVVLAPAGPAKVEGSPVPPASPVDVPPPRPAPWRTVGLVVGGVGVVGLGLGATAGFMALADKNAAHCNASNACEAGPLHSANTAATFSTIGMVAGGVLLAGGAALALFAPKGENAAGPAGSAGARPLRVALGPLTSARDGGLLVGGSW
jgi:hypothetical protein